jgi:hypothetical protein
MKREETSGERALWYAAIFFAIGFAIHNGDHIRRGATSVTTELFWAGNAAAVVSVAAIVLVLTRHRLAALVAVWAGFPLAIGFAAAHVLPTWSALSDSFVDGHVSAFSWVAALLEIAGALVLGVAGLYVLRHQQLGIGRAASEAISPSGS